MSNQVLLKAAKGLGIYCPEKSEIRIRKGRKTYCISFQECELRFAVSGQPEVVFLVAPDITVQELKRTIYSLIDPPQDGKETRLS